MRAGIAVAIVYFFLTAALCGVLPLWLDEVIQLVETRGTTPGRMLQTLPRNAGAAPLGYLLQQQTLRVTGYSVRWARFPAALFGSAAVFVVALLGLELGLRRGWLGAALFALFPLTLRYTTEARIYSLGLFLSVLATFAGVRLAKRPSWFYYLFYLLALTLAIYTQPYAALVGVAHILWSVLFRDNKAAARTASAAALGIAAFVPWYLWSRHRWTTVISSAGVHFSISAKTPLDIFRELTGAGYWGAVPVLILCVLAIRRWHNPRAQTLLLLLIAVPVAGALLLDGIFNYFIAARQFLWILPALAILAAAGSERTGKIGAALAVLLGVTCLWQDVRFFIAEPREDWQSAADTLAKEVRAGACLTVAPPEQAYLYRFFQPQLRNSDCHGDRAVLAASPYSTSAQYQTANAKLAEKGYEKDGETVTGKTRIAFFHKH